VVCAEVLVEGAIFEHVVGGSKDRSGNGADSFLWAALGADPQKLSSKMAFLFARFCPGALDQRRLRPRCALLHTVRLPLARAFVVSGAEPGPGDQLAFGLESAHVDADRGDHHFRGERTDAEDGGQHFDGYTKGFDVSAYRHM